MVEPSAVAHTAVADAGGYWSELPEDIGMLIIDRLGEEIANIVCFGAVCSGWRSTMQNYLQRYKPKNQYPWRFRGERMDGVVQSTLRFYSFINRKQYSIDVPPYLPRQIVGRSRGFFGLISRSGSNYRRWKKFLHVYNPITRALFTFPKFRCSKLPFINFTVNTVNKKCSHVAFVTTPIVYGGQVVCVAKRSDTTWRYFDLGEYKETGAYAIDDFIFHKDRLYVVTKGFVHTLLFDLSSCVNAVTLDQLYPVADLKVSHKIGRISWSKFVESTDKNDLFLIIDYMDGPFLEVFRFDGRGNKWGAVGSAFTQYFINGNWLYPLWKRENLPLRLQHPSDHVLSYPFIAISARNETDIELKIYYCTYDAMINHWFLPSV